jgi:tRNA/rRNA methyltransferase
MSERPCVILNEPQLAENIGSVARVMANFGLEDLRLVRPRDGWPQDRAWASASGADWPLEGARVYDRVEDAIADLHRLYATTARPREVVLPVITPREAAAQLHAAAAEGLNTGLLFGGERAGLETQDIAFCQAIVTIPIDPRFRSLNLAQAVAINAYEWRTAQADRPPPAFREGAPVADQAMLEGLYGHLEGELETAGFFHPPEKKPSMVRNLRAIFARSSLTSQETRTLRGVITALTKGRGRVLARLARERAEAAKDKE